MKFGTNVDPNKKPLEYKFEADIVSKKQSWVMEFKHVSAAAQFENFFVLFKSLQICQI